MFRELAAEGIKAIALAAVISVSAVLMFKYVGIIEMDGRGWKAEELHAITESEIRAFYAYYRQVMEL